jgi:hypothetical protein
MDGNPGELFLVAVFESREAYWANAQSPEQDDASKSYARCYWLIRNGMMGRRLRLTEGCGRRPRAVGCRVDAGLDALASAMLAVDRLRPTAQ